MSEELIMHIATLEVDIRSMKQDFEAMRQRAETAERQVEGYQEMVQSNLATVVAMKQRAETAERACAEMRDALESCRSYFTADIPRTADEHEAAGEQFTVAFDKLTKALSTSAGTGYLSPAEVKEQVRPLLEALSLALNHSVVAVSAKVVIRNALDYAKAKGWV